MEPGQPKLIKGLKAEYAPATWSGKNTSGFKVYGKNILVRVDDCAGATTGGVIITDEMQERMTAMATTGCIYAIGAEAFRLFDDGSRWTGDTPKAGDRICFEMYAGTTQMGVDGNVYRIMDYRAVAGGVDEEYLAQIGVEHDPIAQAS